MSRLGAGILAAVVAAWFGGLTAFEHARLAGGLWHGPAMIALALGIGYGAFVWLRDALPARPATWPVIAWYAACMGAVCVGLSRTAGTLPAAISAGAVLGTYLVLHAPRPATSALRRLLVAFLLALLPLGWLAHDYYQALSQQMGRRAQVYDARLRREVRKAVAATQKEVERRLAERYEEAADAERPEDAVLKLADDEIVKLAIYREPGARGKVHLASLHRRVSAVSRLKITFDEPRRLAWDALDADLRRTVAEEFDRERAAGGGEDIRSFYLQDERIHYFVGRQRPSRQATWLLLLDHDWITTEIGQERLDEAGLDEEVKLLPVYRADAQKSRIILPSDQMPRYLGFSVPVKLPGALEAARDKDHQGQIGATIWLATLLVWALGALARLYRTAREDVALAEMKQNFVSAISHELKTPLAMIKMYSEMLLLGLVGAGKRPEDYHGIIIQETDRLTRLIDNVLDFSKIQKGTKKYHFEDVDLAEVAAAAMRNMETVFEREGVAVAFEAPPGLVVKADRDAIYQALLNLLSNAVKYGGKAVALKAGRHGREVRVSVQDTGPGIARRDQAKVFRPFYRVGSEEQRTAQGTGLGLALVDEIMKAHRGAVRLQSRPGAGATFTLAFPA
ncbi:MAG: HAMP domain-containing histidine kinase [Candidatus Sericytochromatia bacterium]|nr:HAMP domain-containing histidine kinase [Candidatus Tanganyikabacteria bacterium]